MGGRLLRVHKIESMAVMAMLMTMTSFQVSRRERVERPWRGARLSLPFLSYLHLGTSKDTSLLEFRRQERLIGPRRLFRVPCAPLRIVMWSKTLLLL